MNYKTTMSVLYSLTGQSHPRGAAQDVYHGRVEEQKVLSALRSAGVHYNTLDELLNELGSRGLLGSSR